MTTITKPQTGGPITHAPIAVHPISEGKGSDYARDTIIGAGAGVGVAAFFFFGGVCFWLIKRRRRKQRARKARNPRHLDRVDSTKLSINKEISVSVSAIGASSSPIELQDVARPELEAPGNVVNRGTDEHTILYELEAPSTLGRRPAPRPRISTG
jgi:hypothetical protein